MSANYVQDMGPNYKPPPKEKLQITTHDSQLSQTILTIVRGELINWGYRVSEISVTGDAWGDNRLEIEVGPL